MAFPYRQLFVLGLCRICEPIAFMSIFPYIYHMIESFHITSDSNSIALYAGLVTSVFAAAECLGAGFWGNLSDKHGRKPILLCGMAGTGLSMLVFGFAPNLPVALLARAVGGALNGNIGVLQTTVTEVVKVEAHQARAYAIMPTVWCLGAIIGSALGGALADPVQNFPSLFHAGSIFEKFPYLLTNLVCTGIVIFSMTVGILFLEETHEDEKFKPDAGLDLGRWIISLIKKPAEAGGEETHQLMNDLPPEYKTRLFSSELTSDTVVDLPPPRYRSVDSSPRTSLNPASERELLPGHTEEESGLSRQVGRGLGSAFTKQVMLNIAGFGILAYHTISAEQLLPVFLSLPKSDKPASLPFHFTGGFSLSSSAVGAILSVQGLIQMIATIVVFPIVNRRIGSLWTYRCAVLSYPLLYLLLPYITLLPDTMKTSAVYCVLVWKVTGQAFAFPSSSIMLANSAPSTKVLGTLYGAAASAASASRALGPTVSGLLQAVGLSFNTLGLPWWVNVVVALAGSIISIFMVEEKRRIFGNAQSEASSGSDAAQTTNLDATFLPADCETLIEGAAADSNLISMSATPDVHTSSEKTIVEQGGRSQPPHMLEMAELRASPSGNQLLSDPTLS